MLEGAILLIPLLLIPFYPAEAEFLYMFAVPGLLSVGAGLMVSRLARRESPVRSSRIVVFIWLYGFGLASVPFYLYGNVTIVQAVFESVSGFTTTGPVSYTHLAERGPDRL